METFGCKTHRQCILCTIGTSYTTVLIAILGIETCKDRFLDRTTKYVLCAEFRKTTQTRFRRLLCRWFWKPSQKNIFLLLRLIAKTKWYLFVKFGPHNEWYGDGENVTIVHKPKRRIRIFRMPVPEDIHQQEKKKPWPVICIDKEILLDRI